LIWCQLSTAQHERKLSDDHSQPTESGEAVTDAKINAKINAERNAKTGCEVLPNSQRRTGA